MQNSQLVELALFGSFLCVLLSFSVFDGVPRNKQQIEATSGGQLGESVRDGEFDIVTSRM